MTAQIRQPAIRTRTSAYRDGSSATNMAENSSWQLEDELHLAARATVLAREHFNTMSINYVVDFQRGTHIKAQPVLLFVSLLLFVSVLAAVVVVLHMAHKSPDLCSLYEDDSKGNQIRMLVPWQPWSQ